MTPVSRGRDKGLLGLGHITLPGVGLELLGRNAVGQPVGGTAIASLFFANGTRGGLIGVNVRF